MRAARRLHNDVDRLQTLVGRIDRDDARHRVAGGGELLGDACVVGSALGEHPTNHLTVSGCKKRLALLMQLGRFHHHAHDGGGLNGAVIVVGAVAKRQLEGDHTRLLATIGTNSMLSRSKAGPVPISS